MTPQRMLVAPHGRGSKEACDTTGDSKTMAAAITSSGHYIVVSVCREPSSPALARICLCFRPDETEIRIPGPPGTGEIYTLPVTVGASYTVVAAHGGAMLVHITLTEKYNMKTITLDYFVYTPNAAGDPAARPPSLRLLPPHPSTPERRRHWPVLDVFATGFLYRGEAEFVVAQLTMPPRPPPEAKKDDAHAQAQQAELLMFRNGEWRVERPSVVHSHGSGGTDLLLAEWRPEAVVPVGDDGVLCWVDFSRGVIVSDGVFDQSDDVLWYVPYPAEARPTGAWWWKDKDEQCFLCTNARGELKLVSVKPRRCSHCGCSQHASAVDTWTLDTDAKAWVLETGAATTSMVDDDDSTELWALEKHSRQHLVLLPVVGINGGGGRHVVSDDSVAPTTIDESSRTLSMPLWLTE